MSQLNVSLPDDHLATDRCSALEVAMRGGADSGPGTAPPWRRGNSLKPALKSPCMRRLTRVRRTAHRLADIAVLVTFAATAASACGPTQPVSRATPVGVAEATPAVTPDPAALAANDCIAPPPNVGTKVSSNALGVTVTLPSGWAENPADEGKNGLEATFAVETGNEPNGAIFSANPFPSTMTPHDAVAWEVSQPGSGTAVVKGDCTIAGSPASFFESTVQASLFPGITWVGDGYSLYIAHRGALVHVSVDLPSSNGITTPLPRASVMTDVKSILGSWRWDQP